MKKDVIGKAVASIFVCAIILMNVCTAFATTGSLLAVHLPANQGISIQAAGTRTGAYSYVKIKCDTVYPPSGTDTLKKIQVRLSNGHAILSSFYTLTEGNDYTKISIYEGYLNSTAVYYQLRGNSNEEAYTNVTYDNM